MTVPACWSWPIPVALDLTDPRGALRAWHAGRCGACGRSDVTRLVEDHDHATQLTRGYLCDPCNVREGLHANGVFDLYRQRPPVALLGLAPITYPGRHDERLLKMRMHPELHAVLAGYATDQHRSIGNAINHLIAVGLHAEGSGPADDLHLR